ncbi:amidohydrolase family protein [Stenotrophomonas sp. MMGLT7]|uniref:amidohydrolase family protein n=1 Tax=Stenotrophomonas sp. MMGLT7 TaxID=2901227 RepID=UPI001E2BDE23|nr:amidohydrolase family protein [Stenotrophomonas sp. MMGLT7]MCD7099241.1 amidohydrolase family protein [Stenotrophomonas sp. MMGLT7]
MERDGGAAARCLRAWRGSVGWLLLAACMGSGPAIAQARDGVAGATALPAARAGVVQESLSVVSNGEVVGHLQVDGDERRQHVRYAVDNNGRGPKHEEILELDAGGMPLSWTVKGSSLMGGEVDERYRWHAGRAQWTSAADAGEAAAARPGLYALNDASPWASAVYARVLLDASGGTLPVLPGGELRLQRLRQMQVGAGAKAVAVTVYRLGGLSLAPSYLMLDARRRLFAEFTPEDIAVRGGYEDQAPALLRLAGELEIEHARELQRRLAHTGAEPLRIANVRVFDPREGRLGPPVSVLVREGRIAAIEAGAGVAARPGERVYDGEGGTLIPGLHDMHSHTTLSSGLWYLAAGVTSTRDMGNDNDFLLDLVPRIEAGEIAGPRIVRNGFLEGRSPYSARNGFIPATLPEALEDVRWYKRHGYWQIKIYNSMDPDWVPAIAAEAHRLGMTVTGHIPAFATPERMIEAGYDELTHVNQLMLGWLLRPDEDTRTPLRLTAMARAGSLDLDAPQVRRTLALMKQREIPLDPTAVILERLMLSRARQVGEGDAAYLAHMPIGYQRYRKRTFVPGLTPELDRDYRRSFDTILALLKRLHDQGTRLLPGTDDTTGFTVLRELELYAKAGIEPAEVLRLGTLGCEEYLGRAGQLGTIEPGRRADFVLLAGDPVEDISAIRQARMVVKDTQMYFPEEIYRALGVVPFAPAPVRIR